MQDKPSDINVIIPEPPQRPQGRLIRECDEGTPDPEYEPYPKSSHKVIYNGPQTWWNIEFIRMIDMRMDDRPWTPEQELTVMRTVGVLIRMVGEDILQEIFRQHIPQVISVSGETVCTKAVISVEKIKDIINKRTNDNYITREI